MSLEDILFIIGLLFIICTTFVLNAIIACYLVGVLCVFISMIVAARKQIKERRE